MNITEALILNVNYEWWQDAEITALENKVIISHPPVSSKQATFSKNLFERIEKAISAIKFESLEQVNIIERNLNFIKRKFRQLFDESGAGRADFELEQAVSQSRLYLQKMRLEKELSKFGVSGVKVEIKEYFLSVIIPGGIDASTLKRILSLFPEQVIDQVTILEISESLFPLYDIFQILYQKEVQQLHIESWPRTWTFASEIYHSLHWIHPNLFSPFFWQELARLLVNGDPSENLGLKAKAVILAEKGAYCQFSRDHLLECFDLRFWIYDHIPLSHAWFINSGLPLNCHSLPFGDALNIDFVDFGRHLGPFDQDDLQTGYLHLVYRQTNPNQNEKYPAIIEAELKISNAARQHLEETLQCFLRTSTQKRIEQWLKEKDICDDLIVTRTGEQYWIREQEHYIPATIVSECVVKISFGTLGWFSIGNDSTFPALYNRILIATQINEQQLEKAYQSIYLILTLLGLGHFAHSQLAEETRHRRWLIYLEEYYPRLLEQYLADPSFAHLPVANLKERLLQDSHSNIQEDELKAIDAMTQYEEIAPGCFEYIFPDTVPCYFEASARAFIQSIGSIFSQPRKSIQTVVNMIKLGALSTQARYSMGVVAPSDSPIADHRANSADRVFVRLLTTRHLSEESSLPISDIRLPSRAFLLYKLSLMRRPSYQYPRDQHGTKQGTVYKNRGNKLETIQLINSQPGREIANEWMFFYKISENDISGCVLADLRPYLIDLLKQKEFITEQGEYFLWQNSLVLKDRFLKEKQAEIFSALQTHALLIQDGSDWVFEEENLVGATLEDAITNPKQYLVDLLTQENLIVMSETGEPKVLGIPINEFIHVGNQITLEMAQHSFKDLFK